MTEKSYDDSNWREEYKGYTASRYDKKGQAKRDILKAMHYCLLLYYFSGQTNETPTRGYETF